MAASTNICAIKIDTSVAGFGSRAKSSLVFHGLHAAVLTIPQTKPMVDAVCEVLQDVMLDVANISRVTVTRMMDDDTANRADSISFPLAKIGRHAVPVGGAPAVEESGLRIEKQAVNVKRASAHLRYCLTADEYATHTETGALPERFEDLPTAAGFVGQAFNAALLSAFDANGFPMVVWSKNAAGLYVGKDVSELLIARTGLLQLQRKKTDAAKEVARNIQRLLQQHYRNAKRMLQQFLEGVTDAEFVASIRNVIVAAYALYNSVDALTRGYIRVPKFSDIINALPAPA